MNKPLFTVLEDLYPLQHTQPTNYGELPDYNSNRIIPDYHYKTRPSPSQQYLNYLNQYPDVARNKNIILPRETSFADMSPPIYPQYSQFTVQPPFAGGIPYLKNARAADNEYKMSPNGTYPVTSPTDFVSVGKEPFRYTIPSPSEITCDTVLTHIKNCKTCKSLLQCNNRIWMVLFFTLMLMFCIIIYLLQRNKNE